MFDPRSYFLDNASDYASVFQQSLVNHPTAKQFVVVPGRTEKTYSFVPTHLKRLLPNNCSKILTVNRPTGAITTEDLKTYLGTIALLTLADMSKAETLRQTTHRAIEETITKPVFKDIVGLIEKAEKQAPSMVGRLTSYYNQMRDYYFDQLKTARHNAKVTCPGIDVIISDDRRDVGIGLNEQLLDTDSEQIIIDWLQLTGKDINALPDAIYAATLVKADRLATCIQHLAGAIRSYSPHVDFMDHTHKLLKLQAELQFEIKNHEHLEKKIMSHEKKLMDAIEQMDKTARIIRDIAEKDTKKEKDL